jgi:hypothetical protein
VLPKLFLLVVAVAAAVNAGAARVDALWVLSKRSILFAHGRGHGHAAYARQTRFPTQVREHEFSRAGARARVLPRRCTGTSSPAQVHGHLLTRPRMAFGASKLVVDQRCSGRCTHVRRRCFNGASGEEVMWSVATNVNLQSPSTTVNCSGCLQLV